MEKINRLCIIGTGSQGRYVIENIKQTNSFDVIEFVDVESEKNIGSSVNGVKIKCVLKDILSYFNPDEYNVIIAYGKNIEKRKIAQFLRDKNYKFATIVSPKAYISSNVKIGEGCIINPNVTILPNTIIGDHVIIHSGSVIEHDNIIGNYVNIAPSVTTAGYVSIGEGTYLYTGSIVIPKKNIGKWSIVGAGSIVINDLENYGVFVGNPARKIKDNLDLKK